MHDFTAFGANALLFRQHVCLLNDLRILGQNIPRLDGLPLPRVRAHFDRRLLHLL